MDSFFGIHIPSTSAPGMVLPLMLAVLLGGLIGLEREVHGHPAGLRTHILVCVGSALITMASIGMRANSPGTTDPSRIAAQIVSGIGFLGAGAIIREGASVRGLTTAASVWTTAGIGLALGVSPYFGQLAVITTAIVLFTLWLLNLLEDWIDAASGRATPLEAILHDTSHASAQFLAEVAAQDVHIESVRFEPGDSPNTRRVTLRVRFPKRFDRTAFMQAMADREGVIAVSVP